MQKLEIKLFFGVGHETTGATTYTESEIRNLLEWIDLDPQEHHAVIDSTSMLGAMPWPRKLSQAFSKMLHVHPISKAIGGISGYFIFSMTEAAMVMIDDNMTEPSWAIPRQLKIAVPSDMKRPLSSIATTKLGPIYDPIKGEMTGVLSTLTAPWHSPKPPFQSCIMKRKLQCGCAQPALDC